MMNYKHLSIITLAGLMALASCKQPDPIPTEVSEDTYAGGQLGTTFNQSASAYEDPTPAVEYSGMTNAFKYGEFFFEHTITQNNPPFNGLGPLYVRSSCESLPSRLRPRPPHGPLPRRRLGQRLPAGGLQQATDAYESSVAGMPQTKAVAPFKPSIDETQIQINWLSYTDEWGNRFPDGETYDLIYPEVNIPEDAFYAPLEVGGQPIPYSDFVCRLESTIGIYGTGLIDAIPDDSLRAQYQKEYNDGASLNPAIWAGNDWAPTLRQHHPSQALHLRPQPRPPAGCPRRQRHLEHHQRDAPHQNGPLHDRRLRHQSLARPRRAGRVLQLLPAVEPRPATWRPTSTTT